MGTDTLTGLLRRNAAGVATLRFDVATLTYADLLDRSARVAEGLRARGIGPGDRVAVWLANVPEWLDTFFACARLGAVVVNLNPRYRRDEVGDIVSRSGTEALVFDSAAGDGPAVLAACETLGHLRVAIDLADPPAPVPNVASVSFATLAGSRPMAEDWAVPDAGCLIYTTSGTTSRPKFVIHDQQTLVGHAFEVAAAIGADARSVTAVVVPFCATYGMTATLAGIAAGGPMVIPTGWDAVRIAALLRDAGVTHAVAIDDGVEQLLGVAGPESFASMQCMGIAGMNPRLEQIYDAAEAKGLPLVGVYGSSELQALLAVQDRRATRADRIVRGGRLVSPAGTVRAADPATGAVLPPGQPGELQFRLPGSVMRGYFGNPEATAAAFTEDGFFRSGDLGHASGDGRFTYLARMGDSMRLGGYLVDPAEIEAVLQTHPDVAEAQVVSVETDAGTRPVAFVIPAHGRAIDADGLRSFTAERLARYKVPVRYVPIDEFPKTVSANGAKVQKAKLREMAATPPP